MALETVPSFSRVDISATGRADIIAAAMELRLLADQLDHIAGTAQTDEDAVVLSHHKIKATSKKLRAGGKPS